MQNELQNELIPLIVQDAESKQVLSLFYCDKESIKRMRETGFVWRYSRSKRRQIKKGASSGDTQKIISLQFDCDGDALLALVKQNGKGACHTGSWSCFSRKKNRGWSVLDELCGVIKQRKKKAAHEKNSFVASIINKRKAIGEKLVEEASELAEALSKKPEREVVWEAADLLFFTLLALANKGVDVQRVLEELKRRRRK